jgi:hypothetical protein
MLGECGLQQSFIWRTKREHNRQANIFACLADNRGAEMLPERTSPMKTMISFAAMTLVLAGSAFAQDVKPTAPVTGAPAVKVEAPKTLTAPVAGTVAPTGKVEAPKVTAPAVGTMPVAPVVGGKVEAPKVVTTPATSPVAPIAPKAEAPKVEAPKAAVTPSVLPKPMGVGAADDKKADAPKVDAGKVMAPAATAPAVTPVDASKTETPVKK